MIKKKNIFYHIQVDVFKKENKILYQSILCSNNQNAQHKSNETKIIFKN